MADGAVTSQAELRRRLRARGIQGVAGDAVARHGGDRRPAGGRAPTGPRYLVDGDGGALPLEPVRRLVDGVDRSDTLVVVRTKASAAVDGGARARRGAPATTCSARSPGDDTVFVAPRRSREGDRLARRLRALLGIG